MAEAARLRLVDTQTGETREPETHMRELEDQLAGAEKDIAAWRTRYANLKRDRDAEAEDHSLFPQAKALFDHWRMACNHPRSRFTPERFWLLLPHLERYGPELCQRAIDGAAYDPFITARKNGSQKRHDGIELIFRSAEKLEEFANRAPREEQ